MLFLIPVVGVIVLIEVGGPVHDGHTVEMVVLVLDRKSVV